MFAVQPRSCLGLAVTTTLCSAAAVQLGVISRVPPARRGAPPRPARARAAAERRAPPPRGHLSRRHGEFYTLRSRLRWPAVRRTTFLNAGFAEKLVRLIGLSPYSQIIGCR